MLVVGFASQFWLNPKKGLSEVEIAAANVARMEAQVKGKSITSTKPKSSNKSPFAQKLHETKAKQFKILAILAMIFGVGFLGYTFIKRD